MIRIALFLAASRKMIRILLDHSQAAVTAPIPPMDLSAIAQRKIA